MYSTTGSFSSIKFAENKYVNAVWYYWYEIFLSQLSLFLPEPGSLREFANHMSIFHAIIFSSSVCTGNYGVQLDFFTATLEQIKPHVPCALVSYTCYPFLHAFSNRHTCVHTMYSGGPLAFSFFYYYFWTQMEIFSYIPHGAAAAAFCDWIVQCWVYLYLWVWPLRGLEVMEGEIKNSMLPLIYISLRRYSLTTCVIVPTPTRKHCQTGIGGAL